MTFPTLLLKFLGTLGLLMGASCFAADQERLNRNFLSAPMDERRTMLLNFPLDQQVELYLAAMQKHPPDLALADALARNGEEIIPLLKQRMSSEDWGLTKLHLIDVFVRMQQRGIYSVAADQRTMRFLDQHAAAIEDAQWKLMAIEMVNEIQASQQ